MHADTHRTTMTLWSEAEFVDRHDRLKIGLLLRAGALVEGVTTWWQWPSGKEGNVCAGQGVLIWTGGQAEPQTIRFGWLELKTNTGARPRFFCGLCGRGCYHLHDKAGAFACRKCCGFDYRVRHCDRSCPELRQIVTLRRQLGADPSPLGELPPRPGKRSSRRDKRMYDRLCRAEAALCRNLTRLIGSCDDNDE